MKRYIYKLKNKEIKQYLQEKEENRMKRFRKRENSLEYAVQHLKEDRRLFATETLILWDDGHKYMFDFKEITIRQQKNLNTRNRFTLDEAGKKLVGLGYLYYYLNPLDKQVKINITDLYRLFISYCRNSVDENNRFSCDIYNSLKSGNILEDYFGITLSKMEGYWLIRSMDKDFKESPFKPTKIKEYTINVDIKQLEKEIIKELISKKAFYKKEECSFEEIHKERMKIVQEDNEIIRQNILKLEKEYENKTKKNILLLPMIA